MPGKRSPRRRGSEPILAGCALGFLALAGIVGGIVAIERGGGGPALEAGAPTVSGETGGDGRTPVGSR